MHRKLAVLVLLAGVAIAFYAAQAAERFQPNGGRRGITAERLLTATDLVNTSQLSRWITAPDFAGLVCELDVTAIAGGSATVYMRVMGCDPPEVAAGGCTDLTDTTGWYQGTNVTTVTNNTIGISRNVVSGIGTTTFDKDAWGPLPPIFAIAVTETGDTTVSYTLDCMWWN